MSYLLKICGMEEMIPAEWLGRDLFNDARPDASSGRRKLGDKKKHFAQSWIGMWKDRYRIMYPCVKDGSQSDMIFEICKIQ